jgi:hypothetical protein
MRRSKKVSDEEKVAIKLSDLVSDVRLDLDQVGIYLGRTLPSTPYRRLNVILESAEYEKEKDNVRNGDNYLF